MQEWNYQIDELKRQQEYDASCIQDEIRRNTEAINRANELSNSKSYSKPTRITDYIPRKK